MNIGHNSGAKRSNTIPASMEEIADALGEGIVFLLIDHFGGTEIKIPYKLKEGHPLERLGVYQAQLLCENFPEKKLHVPLNVDRTRLADKVHELEAAGLKRAEIARELGCTQRHVRRVANRAPPDDDRQGDLFSGMDD